MLNRFKLVTVVVIIISSIIVLFISNTTINNKTSIIKHKTYSNTQKNIKKQIDLLIKNKQESTLSIALALSRDKHMIEALRVKDDTILKLDKLSDTLSKFTRFKHVWFQIIDNQGKNFYRSWTDDRGDLIYKSRVDIKQMLKTPQVTSTISVGKFDMTFKTMVPIYDIDKTYLGIFEMITHFNSISRKLSEENFKAIILADKKYKKQLIKPFTNNFIEDYYIANLDADKSIIKIIEKNLVKSYLENNEDYFLDEDNGYFITVYHIPDINNNEMGYIILFKKFEDFTMRDLKTTKKDITFIMFLIIIAIFIFGYYILNKKYNSVLQENLDYTKKEKEKIDAILSAQPYIIMLIHDDKSFDVNDKFFDFFNQYKSIEEFKKEHKCICELFVTPDKYDDSYIVNKENWIEKIVKNSTKEFKVAMKKDDELYHFIVRANKPNIQDIDDDFIILTFVDITDIKRKDELLFEQSKHASMGEMIGNIAHQWRQPLSVISTGVTGMLFQKRYDTLSDEMFVQTCNNINENAQYLSRTIDDFRDFIKGDSTKELFNMKENIDKFLHIVDSVIKDNEIKIILNIEKSLEIEGYPNELLQCLINLFNNSKDAFIEKNSTKRYIFIDITKNENNVDISFKDSAGGINLDIIDKIFEPYFTTKHKSLGTGLGLHMTYNLITTRMNGKVRVMNTTYGYNNDELTGMKFKITLPLS